MTRRSLPTYATSCYVADGVRRLVFHDSEILRDWTNSEGRRVIEIDCKGWSTSITTRRRVNQYFEVESIPWNLYQSDFDVFLFTGDRSAPIEYFAGMVIDVVTGALVE